MSINENREESIRERNESNTFWTSKTFRRSAATTLVDVATTIAAAQAVGTTPAFCCRCQKTYNPNRSAAQFTNVFCSEECEREFVYVALGSLTIEDCISLQDRLLQLFSAGQTHVV